jgi:hypothetical protein
MSEKNGGNFMLIIEPTEVGLSGDSASVIDTIHLNPSAIQLP